MPLIDKIDAIAAAVREKFDLIEDLTIDEMIAAIGEIESDEEPGTVFSAPNASYPIVDKFTALGNAIRAKTGGTERLTLDEMPEAILGAGKAQLRYELITVPGEDNAPDTYYLKVIGVVNCHQDEDIIVPGKAKWRGETYTVEEISSLSGADKARSVEVNPYYTKSVSFEDCPDIQHIIFNTNENVYDDGTCTVYYFPDNLATLTFKKIKTDIRISGKSKTLQTIYVDSLTTYQRRIFFPSSGIDDYGTNYYWNNSPFQDIEGGFALKTLDGTPITRVSASVYPIEYAQGKYSNCNTITSVYGYGTARHEFRGCPNLRTVELKADSGAIVRRYSFAECPNLESVIINKYALIEEGAFANSKIKTLDITGGTIDWYAFADSGVETASIYFSPISGYGGFLHSRAFNGCESLQKVYLLGDCGDMGTGRVGTSYHSSVEGNLVFDGCDNLTDIYVHWSGPDALRPEAADKAPWGAPNATMHYNYTA